jgi:hypothetical protein
MAAAELANRANGWLSRNQEDDERAEIAQPIAGVPGSALVQRGLGRVDRGE